MSKEIVNEITAVVPRLIKTLLIENWVNIGFVEGIHETIV